MLGPDARPEPSESACTEWAVADSFHFPSPFRSKPPPNSHRIRFTTARQGINMMISPSHHTTMITRIMMPVKVKFPSQLSIRLMTPLSLSGRDVSESSLHNIIIYPQASHDSDITVSEAGTTPSGRSPSRPPESESPIRVSHLSHPSESLI